MNDIFVGNVYELDGLSIIATNVFLTERGIEYGASRIVATASSKDDAESLMILIEQGANTQRGKELVDGLRHNRD